MRKTALVLAIIALTTLIVLPVVTSVNHSAGNPTSIDRTQRADGSPLPPPPKPPTMGVTLVADGSPLPPPPPPKTGATLVADGSPLPPPPKPPTMGVTLVADGWPLPPPIPPKKPSAGVRA